MTIYIVRLCMYEIHISLKANEYPITARRSWKGSSTGSGRSLKSASRLDEGMRIRLDTTATPVFGMKEEKKQQFVL